MSGTHRHARTRPGAALLLAGANRRLGITASALLFAAAVLALVATPARSSPLQPPPAFWGVIPQSERPQSEYQTMKAGGVDSVRFGFPWDAIEPQPGSYDFSLPDVHVRHTALAGLEVFPALHATPTFYGQDSRTLPVQTAEQRAAWEAYLRALVRRYGPGGSFWSENPQIPAQPIRLWQIWNEANFFYFAEPRSPELYAELVKLSHRAITSEDPGAKIVLSGLFGHPREAPPLAYQAADFLDLLYEVDGITDFFDGVALHPYALDASELPGDINEIREVMLRHGDDKTGLYLTEVGWGDGTDTGFEKGPEGQLREMSQAFKLLVEMHRKARIQRIFWFAWDDIVGSCRFCESVGLFSEAAQPKPAWFRFVSHSGCFGRFSTIIGTAASETLIGTAGPDVIVAAGGEDQILGGGGDDRICAEDGNDSINSGPGKDLVSGGPGGDTLLTGSGADRIFGDPGNDRILAGAGPDRAFGDTGLDRIVGSGGFDVLFGDAGADLLFGNDGNDRLSGHQGNDRLFGHAGDDLLIGGAGKDTLRPGPGDDRTRP